jgi:diguanylate cyclase (GGDEF)-like protein
MSVTLDLTADLLADAPLTPEQRYAWEAVRKALADTRARAQDLEKRVKSLEQNSAEEQSAILTRTEFNREVARMLAFDERYGGTSSVLYLDFDNMEDVTASYGKSVTNAALRDISNVLMKNVRGSDIIGRLAPDEFGVLLVRCDNVNAWKKGKELVGLLAEALEEVHACKLNVTVNYGAYTFQEDEDVATGLKQAAQLVTKAGAG